MYSRPKTFRLYKGDKMNKKAISRKTIFILLLMTIILAITLLQILSAIDVYDNFEGASLNYNKWSNESGVFQIGGNLVLNSTINGHVNTTKKFESYFGNYFSLNVTAEAGGTINVFLGKCNGGNYLLYNYAGFGFYEIIKYNATTSMVYQDGNNTQNNTLNSSADWDSTLCIYGVNGINISDSYYNKSALSPRAYWKFDEGTGNALDYFGRYNLSQDWTWITTGKVNNAVAITGASYLNTTINTKDFESMSINVWLNQNGTGPDNGDIFYYVQDATGNPSANGELRFIKGGGGYSIRDASSRKDITISFPSDSTWHMYTMMVNSSTADTYIDAVLVNRTSLNNFAFTGNRVIELFDYQSTTGPLSGLGIDEMRIINRILTPTEITDLFNNPSGIIVTTNLNSPPNSYNSTQKNVTFNCTSTSSNNIQNISLIIDGNTNYTISNGLTNYSSLQLELNLSYGTHSWNCSSTEISNFKGDSETRNLTIYKDFSINNISMTKNQIGFNTLIQSNLSVESPNGIIYCNFTVKHPSGNQFIKNVNGTGYLNNNLWNSSNFLINSSGTYNYNLTCLDTFGNEEFLNGSTDVSSYTLTYLPTNYSLNAILEKNESNNFSLYFYDDVSSKMIFNYRINISNYSYFENLSLDSYTLTLNSSDDYSNKFSLNALIKANSTIPFGIYNGNVTFDNITYALSYTIPFSYAINPPGGVPTIYYGPSEICTSSFDSNCSFITAFLVGDGSTSKSYQINNTGFYNLTYCNIKGDGGLSSYISSSVNFSVSPGLVKQLDVLFSASTGTYSGNIYVQCDKGDIGNNPVSSPSSNRPPWYVVVLSGSSDTLGGGGGEVGRNRVEVVALNKPISINRSFENLSLAIIYARTRESCLNFSLSKNSCDLTKVSKDKLLLSMLVQGVNITYEELALFINKYNDNDIFSFLVDESLATKYNLFRASVKAGVIKFEINPIRIDAFFLVLSKDSKFSYLSTSNKIIDSIEVVSGDFDVTKKDTSSVLTYFVNNTDFDTKVVTGRISYTSITKEAFFQDVQIRVINLTSPKLLIGGFSLIVIGIILYFIIKKRMKK